MQAAPAEEVDAEHGTHALGTSDLQGGGAQLRRRGGATQQPQIPLSGAGAHQHPGHAPRNPHPAIQVCAVGAALLLSWRAVWLSVLKCADLLVCWLVT